MTTTVQHEAKLEATSSGSENEAEEISHKRTISIPMFLSTIAVLIIVALALGIGLGLGLPRTKVITITEHTPPAFNYSSFYGIPDNLPVVNVSTMVNQTELDMGTGFKVSSTPTIREYTLNITQVLGSPDGKC